MKRDRFSTAHVHTFFEALRNLRDLDLLILKAHAGIEQLMFTILATRIGVDVPELPQRLQFKMTCDLALAGTGEGRFAALLERFSAIRNMVAHQLEPDWSTGVFGNFIEEVQDWAANERGKFPHVEKGFEVGWLTADWGDHSEIAVARRIRGAFATLFSHVAYLGRQIAYQVEGKEPPAV